MSRNLFLVALSMFIWGIGEGMFYMFQPLYLQQWGASPVLIGALLGGLGAAMAVAQIPAGYLADRLGSRGIMLAAWLTGLLSTLIMAFAPSMEIFIVGMLAYGLTAFVTAPVNSYAVAVRGRWSVQRALTFVSAMFQLGAMIGPVAGGVLGDRLGLQVIYRIATGFFVVSTAIIFMIKPQVMEKHPDHEVRGKLHHNNRYILFLGLSFITVLATYLPQPLTPNYLQNQHHLSLATIGWMGAIGYLGNAVLTFLPGSMNATSGFLFGQMLMGLSTLLLWRGDNVVWFGLAYFTMGGFRLLRSMGLAYSRSIIHAADTGLAFGIVETCNYLALILAPALAGLLYAYDPRLVYITSLGLIIIVFLINLRFMVGKQKLTRKLSSYFPRNNL
jgi:MFS family permease